MSQLSSLPEHFDAAKKARLDQDIQAFFARRVQIAYLQRWVRSEQDELSGRKIAAYIAMKVGNRLLEGILWKPFTGDSVQPSS